MLVPRLSQKKPAPQFMQSVLYVPSLYLPSGHLISSNEPSGA